MLSTAIVYDRKRQASGKNNGEGSLEVRLTVNRKSYYISTGVRVREKNWAGAVVGRPDADALNNRLGIIVSRVAERANQFIEQRKPIDVNLIREYIYDGTKVEGKEDRMLAWVEDQVPLLKVCDGTRKHYELLLVRLKEFGRLRSWSDLTVENIYLWDDWLHKTVKAWTKRNEAERNGTDGTIYNYHKHLKALLNRAVDFGLLPASPYSRLRGKFKRGERESVEYLTEEQMRQILNTQPVAGTQMETVRDLFVFQMLTGMSYSDMQSFELSDYKREKGKNCDVWVYRSERIKTGVPYVSVLLPPVVDVLERHGWKVPQMPNQKYNCLLKTFGAVLGIENLHSHLARHTFATYMLSKNVKVQNVMRMMGHRKIEQTMRYAKVLAQDVKEDYERISQIISKTSKQ